MKKRSSANGGEDEELRAILVMIDTEVDRQLSDQNRSASSLFNRAALLITSSLIFVSIPKVGDGSGFWYGSALVFGLLASILGVVALFFRSNVDELKLSSLEDQLVGMTEMQAMRALTKSKRVTLTQDRDRIQRISKFVILGFASLSISLACTVIYSSAGV